MRSLHRAAAGALVILLFAAACGSPQPSVSPTTALPAAQPTAAPGGASSQPSVAGSAAATNGTFTFGVLIPLTGPAADIGNDFRLGLDMAVQEINAQGGAGGMKLEPNVQDHKGTAQGGTEAMNQLVNIAKVPFVISSFSSVTLAAQPIAAQNHVLLINCGGTDSTLLDKPWLYDNQVMAPHLMPALAQYSWDNGKRKAAMLTSNDGYGDGSRKAFQSDWQKLGGQIVADELFNINATDWSAQLTKIRAANPDVIMVVAVGQPQGQILKQARALGVQTDFVGPLATTNLITAGGDAATGFVDSEIAVDFTTTDPGARHFIDTFKQKFNKDPYWGNGTIYEAVYYLRDLIDAIVKQGGNPSSGDTLLKALEANPQFHNYLAGGTVRFAADHSVDRTLALQKVVSGKFQVLKLFPAGQ